MCLTDHSWIRNYQKWAWLSTNIMSLASCTSPRTVPPRLAGCHLSAASHWLKWCIMICVSRWPSAVAVYTALRPGVISIYNKHHKPCIQKDTRQPCCCHIAGHMQRTCHTAINQTLNKSIDVLVLGIIKLWCALWSNRHQCLSQKCFLKQIPYACLHNCSMHLCAHLNVMHMTYVMRRYTSSQHHWCELKSLP